MIQTFVNMETAALYAGFHVRRFSGEWQQSARRKLVQLHQVVHIDELRIPPGNRLEKLSGVREGQWSIRINAQWRICFTWRDGHAWDVEIVDYHQESKMGVRIEDIDGLDFSDVADPSLGKMPPVAPGEILMEDFLKPMKLTQYRLAKEIGVPARRIGEVVAGKRAITADTGLRLSRFFGVGDAYWIGLQAEYDMTRAREAMRETLTRIKRYESHA